MNLNFILNPTCVALKCDPISVGAAALAGGSSVLSGLLGLRDTNKTNQTNMKIAQMNNDWSERMLDKQNAYNTDMWNKTNEYNTYANQRKRLEEAGLNPYMMLNGSSPGSASSVTSAGVNGPSTPNILPQNFDFISGAVGNSLSAMGNLTDIGQKQEITNGIRIENKFKVADILSRIYDKLETAKNTAERTNYQKLLNSVFSENNRIDNENKLQQTELYKVQRAKIIADTALTNQMTDAQIIKNKYLDRQTLMEINEIGSRILLNQSSAKFNAAAARNQVAQAVQAYAQANKINIDAKTADAISGSVVSAFYSDATIKEEKAKNMYDYGSEQAPDVYDVNGSFNLGYKGLGVNAGGKYSGYRKRHH